MTAGTLYIVSTPIGNLADITYRAVRTLGTVGLIAAEDTRRTKKLLSHYGITNTVTSYFEQNEKRMAPKLVEKLKAGVSVALVSDAGTPGVSDPGYRLIVLAVENSVDVVPIPGPSAIVGALSVSALPLDRFTFVGFLPSTRARRKRFLLELKGAEQTVVMYESPRRIISTLEDVGEVLGEVRVVVVREMTKLHEQVIRGSAAAVRAELEARTVKGEITLVIRTRKPALGQGPIEDEIRELIEAGFKLGDVVKTVSAGSGLPRAELYKKATKIKQSLKATSKAIK